MLRNCAAIGVESAGDRAALLEHGVGEALSGAIDAAELSARMGRITARLEMLPRHRPAGPLRLDLFHRDARIEKRWIGLHPREFNLFWRLAATPGVRVSRHALLREVWRIDHVPETNSLPVHVSRLRAKLGVFGLAWLIETDPADGYRLVDKSAEGYATTGKGEGAYAALDRPALLRDEGCRSHEQEG
ncbi:winged helix-turn-helix domain-containing protein [Qipengyuania spongiae]|uniref:Winged helix-turn-helix domain-containing protein n=1 Tax=Qipengyuania spongiae TaxID=2909673 RepID=A0ABY5T186_9SPHN|nr:winged helix-turn-helix domain-containing protein [Qipengyuania spongiae]UVI40562.1 winged helix-turn-helix domain-containing protein [Qipengyuania spongiae]